MTLINWPLIKHPANWLIVILMLLIFGLAADVILDKFVNQPNKGN